MDTIYYNLNVRRIKVSGGVDLMTLLPAAPASPAGEVLDFDRCRRRLETKAAWKQLTHAAEQPYDREELPEEQAVPAAPPRRERAANWLELCASAAVIAVSLSAIVAFLSPL